jgi:hypothetical protein
MEMRIIIIALNELLANFFLPVPVSPCIAGIVVLVPKGRMLPVRETNIIPFNWKLRKIPTPFPPLCTLHASESIAKERRCSAGWGN